MLPRPTETAVAVPAGPDGGNLRWATAGHPPPRRLDTGEQLRAPQATAPLGRQDRCGARTAPAGAARSGLCSTPTAWSTSPARTGCSSARSALRALPSRRAGSALDELMRIVCDFGAHTLPNDAVPSSSALGSPSGNERAGSPGPTEASALMVLCPWQGGGPELFGRPARRPAEAVRMRYVADMRSNRPPPHGRQPGAAPWRVRTHRGRSPAGWKRRRGRTDPRAAPFATCGFGRRRASPGGRFERDRQVTEVGTDECPRCGPQLADARGAHA